jgi:hypothetical protein
MQLWWKCGIETMIELVWRAGKAYITFEKENYIKAFGNVQISWGHLVF